MKDEEHNQDNVPATLDELHDRIVKQSAKIKATKTTLAGIFWSMPVMIILVFLAVDFSIENLFSKGGWLLMICFGGIFMIAVLPSFGLFTKQLVEETTKLNQHKDQYNEMLDPPMGANSLADQESGQLTEAQQHGELTQKSSKSR